MGLVQALNQLWQPKPSPGLAELVRLNAEKFKLDPKLVACIILQESAADEDAYRFEDDFYERLLKKKQRKDLVGYVPLFPPTLISEKASEKRFLWRHAGHGRDCSLDGLSRAMAHKTCSLGVQY